MAAPILPITLLVNHRVRYGASVIEGVLRYCDGHQHRLVPSIADYGQAEVLRMNWPTSGLIAQITSPAMADAIAATGLPTVNVATTLEDDRWPVVGCDDRAIGDRAADHLLGQHCRFFAFLGWEGKWYSDLRGEGFSDRLSRAGQESGRFETPAVIDDQAAHVQDVADWLAALPRPVGVFACSDLRAQDLLQACAVANLSVPEEVAVLGVGNHEVAHWTTPPMSSIEPDLEGIGFQAASMLHRLLTRGGGRRPGSILLPPKEVVARESTRRAGPGDDLLAAARAWIEQHAVRGGAVAELVSALGVPRRTLEQRFRVQLGRSPLAEIHRVRTEHAKRLLMTTRGDLDEVAAASGFASPQRLIAVFRQQTGQTPGAFRRQLFRGNA